MRTVQGARVLGDIECVDGGGTLEEVQSPGVPSRKSMFLGLQLELAEDGRVGGKVGDHLVQA